MQLSTIILGILKTRRGKMHVTELLRLVKAYYQRNKLTLSSPSEVEIMHCLDLLVEDALVIKMHNGAWDEYQISNKGYARLRAWYAPKKMLAVISNDFAKMLSIVATILSILATYLSIKARY
jgi:DNA-binding PadR family transcriptional regulator